MPITWTTEITGAALAPTTSQTSVTYDGVTFTFDKAMPVGEFVTGEPFVVSSEAFEITSITPESADISGDTFFGNGAMKDPFTRSTSLAFNYADTGTPEQGFDGYIGSTGGGAGFGATLTPYGGNIDPGATGVSIPITLGGQASIVKSVRVAATTARDNWATIEKYVTLTVLSSAPVANPIRPTQSGLTKTVYSADDIDWAVLRSVVLPATFTQNLSEINALIPDDPGNFGANGETLRRFRLDVNLGTSTSNYSGDLADQYARACIVLHSNAYTQAEKQALLYKLVTWGIQLDGMYDRGWRGLGEYGDGAGQHGCFIDIYYLAAFALGNATMIERARAIGSPFDNNKFVTENDLNGVPTTVNASGNIGQAFVTENIGVPTHASTFDAEVGNHLASRYNVISSVINGWEAVAVGLLQNGPSGETGVAAVNNAAVWAYLDTYRTITPYPGGAWNPGNEWRDLWDFLQGLGVYTPYTGVPDQLHTAPSFGLLPYEGNDGDRITATVDGYSWDVSNHDYATETVTGVDFRHSLDGVQYVESTGVGAIGSIAGLLRGVNHHVGLRLVSASGAGPWSQNWPLTIGGGWADTDRNSFPTTGTPTATIPVFTTIPVIHQKMAPQWSQFAGNWAPASATLDANAVELACGLGYVSGQAEPSFAFQWKRNGVDIAGATSQTYTRVPADAGAVLTCTVTPSNSAGVGTPVTTEGITAPAITTLPAGTLIDTDFRGAFAIDYADEIASIVSSGADLVHAPNAYPIGLGENFGSMFWDKTGTNPQGYFDVSRAAATATTYDVLGQLAIDGTSITDRANIVFTIEELGGAVLFTETVLGTDVVAAVADEYHLLRNFTGTITTSTITDLRVKMTWLSGTGGTAGVDMHLTQLSIVAQ